MTVYHRPIVPLYHIEDCRILVQIRSIKGVLTYNIYELYLEAAQAGAGTALKHQRITYVCLVQI